MSSTKKNTIYRVFLAVLIIATLSFIWSNSLADATESTNRSDAVIDKIKPIVDPNGNISSAHFEFLVRKAAHFSEFVLLGAEIYLMFSTFDRWRRISVKSFLLPVVCSFVCAVTDEILQLFSDGRAFSIYDMMIDLAGIVTGCAAILIVRLAVARAVKKRK